VTPGLKKKGGRGGKTTLSHYRTQEGEKEAAPVSVQFPMRLRMGKKKVLFFSLDMNKEKEESAFLSTFYELLADRGGGEGGGRTPS